MSIHGEALRMCTQVPCVSLCGVHPATLGWKHLQGTAELASLHVLSGYYATCSKARACLVRHTESAILEVIMHGS